MRTAAERAGRRRAPQNKERVRLLHIAGEEHQKGYREAMTGKGACACLKLRGFW